MGSARITPKLTDMGEKKPSAPKLTTLGENGAILPVQVSAVMPSNLQSIQETPGPMKLVITSENNSSFCWKGRCFVKVIYWSAMISVTLLKIIVASSLE